MGYNLQKDRLVLQGQRRIFFKRKNIVSFAYPLMILFVFVIAVSIIAPAFAIETTKASALYPEEMREGYTLSRAFHMPQNSPQHAKVDSCLSFITAHLPSGADEVKNFNGRSNYRRPAGKKAVPVAIGFVLGARIALGPREIISSGRRVQFGPEVRSNIHGSNPRALAIAAYRGCKNKQTLKLQNKNKKRRSLQMNN